MSGNSDWSKLCPDLLRLVFESLSSLDFHRAKTVCSNWYSVSETCPLYPWRIIFQGQNSLLLDPIEDKIYRNNLLGIDFSKLHCLASYGNWLLVVDVFLQFDLLNVFTRQRINLPSLESLSLHGGPYRFIRKDDFGCFLELYGTKFLFTSDEFRFLKTAVLWINERSGDFVVAWVIKQFYILSYKGNVDVDVADDDDDERWSLTCAQCEDMAYKDKKLYVYTYDHYINIFDFSGDFPKEVVGEENPYLSHPFHFIDTIYNMKIAVSNSGEVLLVMSLKDNEKKFSICKLNPGIGEWEIVESLGDNMLIFGHGHTIRGPIKDRGIKCGSICFLDDDHLPNDDYLNMCKQSNCGVFDLATSTITYNKGSDCWYSKVLWFVPGQS